VPRRTNYTAAIRRSAWSERGDRNGHRDAPVKVTETYLAFIMLYHRSLGDPEELDTGCEITEVKQCWSVMRWVTKNVSCRGPPCFGRHVKPLVPAALAVVSTHQPALGPRGGLWPVFLMRNP
jgi:hypothetical protein